MSDTTQTPDAAAQVDMVLARTGLPVTPEERERLIRVYPMVAEWTGGLRLPETRYAEPALIYPATFDR
ncbi:MAG TPA: hypothetical protein VFH48_04945 [Chloroflexota bacterium]|nr:hypothetical protein [Chloroflexota bacterium]